MRKLLLFPALATLHVLGCNGDSGMPCGPCGDDSKCGNEWYNSFEQFCFGGIVYDKCGGSTYNPSDPNQRCQRNVAETKCENSWYNSETQFCSSLTVYDKCGGKEYDPSSYRCWNDYLAAKCGDDWYNLTSQRCINNVVETKCGTYNPSTQYCSNGTLKNYYGFMTDSRDGKTYKITVIGTQTWMAENLNYNASNSKCYGDNTGGDSQGNCAKYGRLYNWSTAMNGATSSNTNPSNVRGVCPSGWHLPSDAEWTTLINFVGGSSTAGTKLKDARGTGTDDYGFSALPNGVGYSDGRFNDEWWSATESSLLFFEKTSTSAYYRSIDYRYARVDGVCYNGGCTSLGKSGLISVRCVQDKA